MQDSFAFAPAGSFALISPHSRLGKNQETVHLPGPPTTFGARLGQHRDDVFLRTRWPSLENINRDQLYKTDFAAIIAHDVYRKDLRRTAEPYETSRFPLLRDDREATKRKSSERLARPSEEPRGQNMIIKAEDEASDLPESVRPEETYEDVFKPSFRMKSNWRSNRGKRNSDHIVLNKFTEWFEASGGSKLAQVPAFPLDPEHPLRPGHLLIYTYSPFTRDCLQVWLRMAGHLGNDLWQEVGEGYKSTFITGQPRYLVILNDNTPYWKTEESYRKHKK